MFFFFYCCFLDFFFFRFLVTGQKIASPYLFFIMGVSTVAKITWKICFGSSYIMLLCLSQQKICGKWLLIHFLRRFSFPIALEPWMEDMFAWKCHSSQFKGIYILINTFSWLAMCSIIFYKIRRNAPVYLLHQTLLRMSSLWTYIPISWQDQYV